MASGHQYLVLLTGFCDGYGPKKNRNASMYLLDLLEIFDIYLIYWIYCTYRKHIPVRLITQTDKTQNGGGRLKIEISVANSIESHDFDKNMIVPDVPCSRFALGNLSETCFRDAVCHVNIRQKNVEH